MAVLCAEPWQKGNPGRAGVSFLRTEALLLLLTLSVSLLAVLAGILGRWLGVGRMFLALYVVVFSVMFGRSAVGLAAFS